MVEDNRTSKEYNNKINQTQEYNLDQSNERFNESDRPINQSNLLVQTANSNDVQERSPFISSPGMRDYNRMKYYSALRTGYKQLNKESVGFLQVPEHIANS